MLNICRIKFSSPSKKPSPPFCLKKGRHGIDFETARDLWLDENRIEIHAPHPLEDWMVIIGEREGKLWSAVYTMRDDAIRNISVRRPRKREASLYEKENIG